MTEGETPTQKERDRQTDRQRTERQTDTGRRDGDINRYPHNKKPSK